MRRHERVIVAAGMLGLVLLWEALVHLGRLDASLAPAPSAIVTALAALAGRPEVLTSLGVTAWEVLAAFGPLLEVRLAGTASRVFSGELSADLIRELHGA